MEGPSPSTQNLLWKILLPVAVIIVAVVISLQLLKQQVSRFEATSERGGEFRVGTVMPDFELEKFGGGSLHFSELKTRVALVSFWASWCESCMVEIPSIVKLRNTYQARGFEVIPINVDDNPQLVLPTLLPKLGIQFAVYTDSEGRLAQLFDVHAIPLNVMIDKDRKVLLIESGERDWTGAEIRSLLEQWLAK